MTRTAERTSGRRSADPTRAVALSKARVLNRLTIGWNVVEGIVALAAGISAGSVSLVGFGLDSAIEVAASCILAWRLYRERHGGCMADDDRRATRAIAVSFMAVAIYVWVDAVRTLVDGSHPEVSIPGLVLVGLALNALVGWWWADPVAAMVIGVIAAGEAVHAWRADALEDTCCA